MKKQYEDVLTKKFLEREYVTKGRSLFSIGKEVGCDHRTVGHYRDRHGIAKQKPLYAGRKMQNHPNWKGHGDISSSYWSNLKNNASSRGIDFNITIEYAWKLFLRQGRTCELSGVDIAFIESKKNTASLDRINPDIPYQEGNVQWVHKNVNLAKQSLSNAEFIAMCRRVYDYRL